MPSYQQHEVQFSHSRRRLTGNLLLPDAPGPHAALVLIQSSSDTDLGNLEFLPRIAEHFARYGIAVLYYDRSGMKELPGDWKDERWEEQASEVLSALRFLQSEARMAPERVGLVGIGQGGWAAAHATMLAPNIGFMISISASGVSPVTLHRHGLEQLGRKRGISEQQIKQALGLFDTMIEAVRQNAGLEQIANFISRLGNEAWDAYWGELDDTIWGFRERELDYDPSGVLKRITCPILAIFGERDPLIPVEKSVAIFEQALSRAGNEDATIHVFPEAGHNIELGDPPRMAPGFLETMVAWVWRRVSDARRLGT